MKVKKLFKDEDFVNYRPALKQDLLQGKASRGSDKPRETLGTKKPAEILLEPGSGEKGGSSSRRFAG
jgi:hypothetical protein